jgi:uncharacterized protein
MATRIATAEEGGTFWTQGLALKPVLEREACLTPVEILASPGASIGTAEAIAAGDVQFGFMAANWVPRALHGERPFVRPLELRVVAPMNLGPLFFIARADGALRTVADLAGKRVVFGPRTSGMAQHAASILRLLGIAAEPLFLDFAAGADAIEEGGADAQLQCPIPNRVMTELARRTPVRVLAYDDAALGRLLAAVPHYDRAVMRRGDLPGLDADLAQPGVLNLLVAAPGTPDAMTAAAARAIAENAAELGRANPLFAGLSTLFADLPALGLGEARFHDGAMATYRALGLLP